MAEKETFRPRHTGRIKDARGRKVTQLDAVAMHLCRKHDIIEVDVLQAIANEKGVRIRGLERTSLFLVFAFIMPFLGISLFTYEVITGDIQDGPYARFAGMVWLCCIPWILWYSMKRSRYGKIAAAMLRHSRCPHCGYNLHGLAPDDTDGATVCPECGCAWNVDSRAKTSVGEETTESVENLSRKEMR